ncbi:MAG: Aldose 1-epimerase, partial [Arthrobacter sp.]|nr:Aldose 1-epimerase [Arthrobacter sp.]
NEPERNTALHGLVFDILWSVAERDESSVALATSLTPGEGYPFPLDLTVDTHGIAKVSVFDPSGTGVELAWGSEWPWVQIHTGDKPVGPDRLGLAVEPMTCPPDAFNSGVDVVRLAPGQVHSASWSIRAVQR